MPHLIIDKRPIEVPEGTRVIEAAARLGIVIPRFCFHPALGALGACRLCAVKFLEGPVKGIKMSCMEEAREGMVVSTTDPEAVDFRRQVIEWLMINHPHDCPVCDAGGECLLQDMTVAGGHGLRRYSGKKRTYRDQDLGAFVQHEMNRCIHCFRCRRFYQDFAGYRDFGALQIAHHMVFGRYQSGALENPFSGNIIDLCPTGVLTDKPSRYAGRRWDFERHPTLCLHCSLGCRVIANVRYREVVRLEAGFNPGINGYFICDRGRYGFYYSHHSQRPRVAMINQKEVSLEVALGHGAERLSQVAHQFGKEAIACQGSFRSSLETQGMLKTLCLHQGWPEPAFLLDPLTQGALTRAVSRLGESVVVSLPEIAQSDFILAIGADPLNEAPILGLAMRQAVRQGASVWVIDPRPVFLPFPFRHLPLRPADMNRCLDFLCTKEATAWGRKKESRTELDCCLEEASRKLRQSQNPIIVCGTEIVLPSTPDLAADLVIKLKDQGHKAGLFFLLPGANAFGALLLSSPHHTFMKTVEGIEQGSINGLILMESDPFRFFPDRLRLEQALEKLDFLLVIDYLPSRTVKRADIFLPSQTVFEGGGHFINQEGRLQWASPVFGGGTPVSQWSHGGHPPRVFRPDLPGGEPRPAWKLLLNLDRRLSPEQPALSLKHLFESLTLENHAFDPLTESTDLIENVRLFLQAEDSIHQELKDHPEGEPDPDSVELFLVERTFGTEELSSFSKPVMETGGPPCLTIPGGLGTRLGLKNGDQVRLELAGGPLEIKIELIPNMSEGVILLPRHPALDWQKITSWPVRLPLNKIQKIEETL